MQQFDTRQFNSLAARLEQHMARYGYSKVDSPIIQPADLFLTRAGDQIIDHLFTFDRRGQQYALRPEFTASAAAMYAEQHHEGDVVRWQFEGAIFEDDPANTNASYQRYGIGAELLGMAGGLAEAEIIAMAAHGLSQQGFKTWRLVLGNVQLMRHLLSTFRLDSRAQRFLLSHLPALANPDQGKDFVLELIDKLLISGIETQPDANFSTAEVNTQQLLDVLLDATQHGTTMGGRTRHDIARRLVQKHQRAAERDQFIQALDFLATWTQINLPAGEAFEQMRPWLAADDTTAQTITRDWQRLIDLLGAFGIPGENIWVQPALARNWDYYTGTVFELHTKDKRRLGGGGRYDELARLLGAEHDIPAVGFTYYANELLTVLPNSEAQFTPALTLVVTSQTEMAGARWSEALRQRGYVVTLATALRSQGTQVTLEPDGSAHWENSVYALNDIDALIAALERVNA